MNEIVTESSHAQCECVQDMEDCQNDKKQSANNKGNYRILRGMLSFPRVFRKAWIVVALLKSPDN